jgi:hypothetical protein
MDPIDPIYLQRIFEQGIHEPDRVQRALRSRDDDSPDEGERQDLGAKDGDEDLDGDEDGEREVDEEALELDLSDAATAADIVVRGEVLDAEPEKTEAPAELEAETRVDSDSGDADAVVVELNEDPEPRLYERRREGQDDSHVDFEV